MTERMQKRTSRFTDLSGSIFERLKVVKYDIKSNPRQPKWICICKCGKLKSIYGQSLRRGYSKSCGCLSLELSKKQFLTHGGSRFREYGIWLGMKYRCYNKKHNSFHNYGGRGISVCNRWIKSFSNFYKDMGKCPENYSIDRIDNNGNYEPSNCRWSNSITQRNNTRRCRVLTFNGKKLNMTQWSKELGMSRTAIRGRIDLGWSVKKTLTTPIKKYIL